MLQRIQRKRSKGFKLPENTTCVDRTSKLWGNPFRLMGDMVYVDAYHRRKILGRWVCFYDDGGHTIEEVVQLFKDMILDPNSHDVEPEIKKRFELMQERIMELKGRNLACFCSISAGSCCHADVLLEIANK